MKREKMKKESKPKVSKKEFENACRLAKMTTPTAFLLIEMLMNIVSCIGERMIVIEKEMEEKINASSDKN